MKKSLFLLALLAGCVPAALRLVDEADGYHASAAAAVGRTADEVDLLAAYLCRRAALLAAQTARAALAAPREERAQLDAKATAQGAKMRAACRLAGLQPVPAGLPDVAVPAPEAAPDLHPAVVPAPAPDMSELSPILDGGA